MARIKNTEKIAKILGADMMLNARKQTKDGRIFIELIRFAKNGRQSKKKIYELNEKINYKKYALIGTARGNDFFHCIYLGATRASNFWERIAGYCIDTHSSSEGNLSIAFYEKI